MLNYTSKFLLTSTGLATTTIIAHFLTLAGKPAEQIKIIFVPTASRTQHELNYVAKSKQELLDLGILKGNIKTLTLNEPVSFEEIKDYDVIYVCGGNIFYLLKKVRESGLGETIKQFVADGNLYFGVSAGSMLVCPTIESATPDDNDVNLTDLTGLNLIDALIEVHYTEADAEAVEERRKKTNREIITLTDDEALLVVDGEMQII